jgi:hypothetical protein
MKNNNSNIIKLEYLHHYDEIIGDNTKRTILFTIPETKLVKLKKNNILLKIIIKNFNSVSLLLKINNCFIDITEKNLSEIDKINLHKVDYSFLLEIFTRNLLYLGCDYVSS